MTRTRLPAVIVALLLFTAQSLVAQQPTGGRGPASRVPVTVMLMDRLPTPDAPFVVVRRPDLTPGDLILLRSDASSEQFSNAVHSLLMIRQAGGDYATSPAVMRMRPGQRRSANVRQLPWIQRVLADLKVAEFKEIEGIGRARAVVIWLPPQGRGYRGSDSRSQTPPAR